MKYTKNVEFKGHFFDTLLLPRILDTVLENKAECSIKQIEIGKSREEESYIRIKVLAENDEILAKVLIALKALGGKPVDLFVRRIEIKGHIIDSLTLPKILDIIVKNDGRCVIEKIDVGVTKEAFSYAKIKVLASSKDQMSNIIELVQKQGAQVIE